MLVDVNLFLTQQAHWTVPIHPFLWISSLPINRPLLRAEAGGPLTEAVLWINDRERDYLVIDMDDSVMSDNAHDALLCLGYSGNRQARGPEDGRILCVCLQEASSRIGNLIFVNKSKHPSSYMCSCM